MRSRAPPPFCSPPSGARRRRCLPGSAPFSATSFPVWLGFRGGKGVATYIGVLLGLYWPAGVAFCVVWLARRASPRATPRSRLLSLAARASALLALTSQWRLAALFLLLTVLLYIRHASNIATAGQRRGGADWREQPLKPRAKGCGQAQPAPAACLAAADPQRECRSRHLPHARQRVRRRRSRHRCLADAVAPRRRAPHPPL